MHADGSREFLRQEGAFVRAYATRTTPAVTEEAKEDKEAGDSVDDLSQRLGNPAAIMANGTIDAAGAYNSTDDEVAQHEAFVHEIFGESDDDSVETELADIPNSGGGSRKKEESPVRDTSLNWNQLPFFEDSLEIAAPSMLVQHPLDLESSATPKQQMLGATLGSPTAAGGGIGQGASTPTGTPAALTPRRRGIRSAAKSRATPGSAASSRFRRTRLEQDSKVDDLGGYSRGRKAPVETPSMRELLQETKDDSAPLPPYLPPYPWELEQQLLDEMRMASGRRLERQAKDDLARQQKMRRRGVLGSPVAPMESDRFATQDTGEYAPEP